MPGGERFCRLRRGVSFQNSLSFLSFLPSFLIRLLTYNLVVHVFSVISFCIFSLFFSLFCFLCLHFLGLPFFNFSFYVPSVFTFSLYLFPGLLPFTDTVTFFCLAIVFVALV
jgi:hypothetical protein